MYNKVIKTWTEIYNEKKKYVWTSDISKSVSHNINPRCAPNPEKRYQDSYYVCRPYAVAYELTDPKQHAMINGLIGQNIFAVSDMDQDKPYEFIPKINIFGVEIDLFKNIFSIPMQDKLIDPLIRRWLNDIAKKEIKHEDIMNNLDIHQMTSSQPAISWKYKYPDAHSLLKAKMKIHICVKPEFLFWTFHKLLLNCNLFIDLYTSLKMNSNFVSTGYLGEYLDIYPNTGKNTNTYVSEGNVYKKEQIFDPDFVIYPRTTNNSEQNRSNVREIIKILLELFPDNLNIASKKYPRFNFKINDCVYVGFGEGFDKAEKIGLDETFTEPLEYKAIECNADEENECMGYNKMSKLVSATQLCTYDDDKKCTMNPIMSKHKLVFKETPIELLVEGKQLNSVENIYDYLQPQ